MRELLRIAKALADENRVRALMFLGEGEMCVCQVIEMLGLAPSTVSRHMALLHQAGLVESRKEGRWVYYRLSGAMVTRRLRGHAQTMAIPGRRDDHATRRGAIRWVRAALAKDPQVLADARSLPAVKRIDKQKLCARYSRS